MGVWGRGWGEVRVGARREMRVGNDDENGGRLTRKQALLHGGGGS